MEIYITVSLVISIFLLINIILNVQNKKLSEKLEKEYSNLLRGALPVKERFYENILEWECIKTEHTDAFNKAIWKNKKTGEKQISISVTKRIED